MKTEKNVKARAISQRYNRAQIGTRRVSPLWALIHAIAMLILFAVAVHGQPVPPAQTAWDIGTLSVVSPAMGPDVTMCSSGPCRGDTWKDVPGLSTAVYSQAGDNLAITVTAEIHSSSDVALRALVDGATSSPNVVTFKQAGDTFDGVRSFTFVQQNLGAGRHIIQIQWYLDLIASQVTSLPSLGKRTLTVNSAPAYTGAGRLVVSAGTSPFNLIKSTPSWENIPDLSASVTTAATSNLEISFSAEAGADSGRFFAQAVVDGVALPNVLFDNAASKLRRGTRSFTFVKVGVPAGAHTVAIQWFAADAGASIRIGRRTLAVFTSPEQTAGGGLSLTSSQSTPYLTSYWADLPDMRRIFTTTDASSNFRIAFSSEANVTSGTMSVRALVDGVAADPGEVLLISNGAVNRAQSFVFETKNLQPGVHTVTIQGMVSSSATAYIGNRSLSVTSKHRHGTDFAQAYPHNGSDQATQIRPRHGTFPMVIICFDPLRSGQTRPTSQQVKNQIQGGDGLPNVAGWFQQNSDNGYYPSPITFLGCEDGHWFVAPAAHQGNWYWDNSAFPTMWQEALQAADASFNFHQYDLNSDNLITGDELAVVILRPQNSPGGDLRTASAALDGFSTPLNVNILDVYFSAVANDATRRINVGLISHEASHNVLNAVDMYTYGGFTTSPGYYSLMDSHWQATHLDPFHKLKSGFLTPDVFEIGGPTTRVNLSAVEESKRVTLIYRPDKNDKEYFILENRWTGTISAPYNYDAYLPAAGAALAVWQIVEDFSLAQQYPPPGSWPVVFGEWGRTGVRLLGKLTQAQQSLTLKWADGTAAHIKVTLESALGHDTSVEIASVP